MDEDSGEETVVNGSKRRKMNDSANIDEGDENSVV